MRLPVLQFSSGRVKLFLLTAIMALLFVQCGSDDSSEAEEAMAEEEEMMEETAPEPEPAPAVAEVPMVQEREKLESMHQSKAAVEEEEPEEYQEITHEEIVQAPVRETDTVIIFVPYRTTYVPAPPADHPEAEELKKMEPVRRLTQFDTPPMYANSDCMNKKHPAHCSHLRLQQYFSRNINTNIFPEDNEDHVEYVSFIVQKDGTIDDSRITVVDQAPHCESCAEEARRLVREMDDDWKPGTWKGEEVDVRVTLPIRFHNYEL